MMLCSTHKRNPQWLSLTPERIQILSAPHQQKRKAKLEGSLAKKFAIRQVVNSNTLVVSGLIFFVFSSDYY